MDWILIALRDEFLAVRKHGSGELANMNFDVESSGTDGSGLVTFVWQELFGD